jgi:hypothetical protein
MMLTYFLINMRKTSSYDQPSIASVQIAQYADSVLQLGYLKKNGESGVEFILKTARYLESLIDIAPRSIGQIHGRA